MESDFKGIVSGEYGPTTIHSRLAVMCPYDGGMDIFLREPRHIRAYMSMFQEWLPPVPSER
jgi:hypothetical protein